MASESEIPRDYVTAIRLQEECRFNGNEIKSFVYHWFALFDKHVDVDQFLPLIADEGLEMKYPGATKIICSHEDFRNWYAEVRNNIKSNTHEVEQIDVKHIAGCKYEVDVVVLWQAVTKEDKYEHLRAHQLWLLDNGEAGQWPRILRCLVETIDMPLNCVDPAKSADILQATFKHYFEMAMDHHTKAATTSNILLIIVGAIIGLVGLDSKIGGTIDVLGGLSVFVIGLFGAVWAWKQHERYHYWEQIAYEYQKELTKIVPMLKTEVEYSSGAQASAAEKFGSLFARKIHDRFLWVSLHGLVAVVGIGLMVASLLMT